jgi:starch synthase
VEKLGNRRYSTLKKVSIEDDLFIKYEDYFDRAGIYGNPGGKSYSDNHLRFSFLASAALNCCIDMGFKPDAIHVHEWSGIAGALIKTVYKDYFPNIPVILTAHNTRYDYHTSPDDIPLIGLPPEGFDIDGYEFWGKVSLLKAAVLYSDKVVFTSAGYLFYLLSTDSQGGMKGFLESQKKKLFSIQSGIDYTKWNLPKDIESFKKQKKDALKKELGLSLDEHLLMYSHIDSYSGNSAQIISTILANLLNMNIHLVIGISESNANYPYFSAIQEKQPSKMALLPLNDSDESLYQRLIAADLFFSINSSEPSLSLFLKASATGTIPVSNSHTQELYLFSIPYISSLEQSNIKANSFISEDASPDLILEQVRLAESIFFENKSLWSKLVINANSIKVSWEDTIKNYLLLLNSPGL